MTENLKLSFAGVTSFASQCIAHYDTFQMQFLKFVFANCCASYIYITGISSLTSTLLQPCAETYLMFRRCDCKVFVIPAKCFELDRNSID